MKMWQLVLDNKLANNYTVSGEIRPPKQNVVKCTVYNTIQ